jgi:hypothetical protein
MLTTAGDAWRAAGLKLPTATAPGVAAGACSKCTAPDQLPPVPTHWGLSVTNTNQMANNTVTTWEKMSQ